MGKIYKDVYAFLLLKCVPHAENQDTRVERDISAALESVFPRSGLRVFVALSGPERRTQLEELAGILLGIRLYNRDTERSDEHYEGCLPKLKMPIDTKLMQRTHEITGLITAQSVSYVNFLAHAKQFNLSPEQDLKHKTDALFQQQTLAYLWTLRRFNHCSGKISEAAGVLRGRESDSRGAYYGTDQRSKRTSISRI